MTAFYLYALLSLPCLAAALMMAFPRRDNLCALLGAATAALALGLVIALDVSVLYGTGAVPQTFTLIEPWPGLALAWHTESFSLLFASISCLLWLVTSIYALGYMRANNEKNLARFHGFFAISMGGALALALAENLFTLFIAYEVLTLATYPLVLHHLTPEARRGAATYLALLMGTSLAFFLPAIIITWLAADTLSFTSGGILAGNITPTAALFLFILYAFGIGKAALMPLHRWLPAAMVAPTPVSALLHAVAVVKAGIFTLLKVAAYIFGAELLQLSGGGDVLLVLAGISVLAASLIAMQQDNLKRRLAYSTVSQLAYAGIAAGLASPAAFMAGALHLLCHAVAKITLFMCAGAIATASGKKQVSQLNGLGRAMPLTCGAFLVASLSLVGIPPLAGFWSKWFLLLAAAASPAAWFAIGVLIISSLLNIAYLVLPGLRMFWFGLAPDDKPIRERPLLCVLPPVFTAFLCLALFWLMSPFYQWASLFPLEMK